MTQLLLSLGSFIAVIYLIAIWFQHEKIHQMLKAVPILCWSLVVGMTLADGGPFGYYLLAGLLLSALGDLFLLNHDKHFLKGLASFFIAHIVYVVGFLSISTDQTSLLCLGILLLVALLYMAFLRRIMMVEHSSVAFVLAVCAYILMITAMVYTAWLTSQYWLIAGSLLFYLSDFTLSWNKFVRPFKRADVVIMVTYYGAQVCLVIGYLCYIQR
ncbi:putative membrane protein YhhN [Croceifilum oryzae]|uniref:Membrane protein YhhN n=1 Tax=Croceifilum oryzae TaxID=1553429 RepID=A0AAJ1TDD2_9BACL|nr:lysoplasmalogenase [Croceifilum oryzae]MDQ0416334.1 putative membrane protein YhhN [Croceifilum oryzae]